MEEFFQILENLPKINYFLSGLATSMLIYDTIKLYGTKKLLNNIFVDIITILSFLFLGLTYLYIILIFGSILLIYKILKFYYHIDLKVKNLFGKLNIDEKHYTNYIELSTHDKRYNFIIKKINNIK